jgi:Tol biopolymer transport system component
MQEPIPNLLESWKEIAAFLGRDKRTAMRWAEKHAMPVHRYPGFKQGRVFAYRSELDRWLETFVHSEVDQTTGKDLETLLTDEGRYGESSPRADSDSSLEEPNLSRGLLTSVPQTVQAYSPSESELHKKHNRVAPAWTRKWSAPLFIAILVSAVTIFALFRTGARSIASPKPAGLIQLTEDGRTKDGLRTDGTNLFFTETIGMNRILVSAPLAGGSMRQIPLSFSNVFLEDVSRDGRMLLVLSKVGMESAGQLWMVPALGGGPIRIGQIDCMEARWSPDGRAIAYTNAGRIYTTDSMGREPRLIADFGAKVTNIIWSPDGRRLRFLQADEKKQETLPWELSSGSSGSFVGSDARRFSLGYSCCADWTWTGDGREFAYIAGKEAKKESHSRSDLSDQNLILTGWFGKQRESVINLGRVQILASSTKTSKLYLLISSAERGELLRFNQRQKAFESYLPGLSARDLSFSKDGQWLSYSPTKDRSLWRSRADGTQALQLVGPPMEGALPAWSPDGRQIAFMGRLPGKAWRVYLVGRDGGTPREALAGDENQGAPSWSPDGKSISFARVACEADNSCGIFVFDLDTGGVRLIPDSETLRTARWSPDGKYIAALERETHAVKIFDLNERRWNTVADNVTGDVLIWSKDSKSVYVSCAFHEMPTIDKIRISDHSRSIVVDLIPLQKMPGVLEMWFGLSPNDSPIVLHMHTSSEVYAFDPIEP